MKVKDLKKLARFELVVVRTITNNKTYKIDSEEVLDKEVISISTELGIYSGLVKTKIIAYIDDIDYKGVKK